MIGDKAYRPLTKQDKLIECLCYVYEKLMFCGINSIDESALDDALSSLNAHTAAYIRDGIDLMLESFVDLPFFIMLDSISAMALRRVESLEQAIEHHIVRRFFGILRECDHEQMFELIESFSQSPQKFKEPIAKQIERTKGLKTLESEIFAAFRAQADVERL